MTQLNYKWNQFDIFPIILNIFSGSKAESITLDFEEESVSFATFAFDTAIALFAKIDNPLIQLVGKNQVSKQIHTFSTKNLVDGTTKFVHASANATDFQMKILEDGLLLISKKDKTKIQTVMIRALEGESHDFTDLKTGLNLKTWYNIPVETKCLINGLSGIDSEVGNVIFSTQTNKNKPTHGSLLLHFKEDFIDYNHFVELPPKTSLQLATKKTESVVKSLFVPILKKDILENFVRLGTKMNRKKRKHTTEENEDENEDTTKFTILRLLDEYISVTYDIPNIEVKVAITTIEKEE